MVGVRVAVRVPASYDVADGTTWLAGPRSTIETVEPVTDSLKVACGRTPTGTPVVSGVGTRLLSVGGVVSVESSWKTTSTQ